MWPTSPCHACSSNSTFHRYLCLLLTRWVTNLHDFFKRARRWTDHRSVSNSYYPVPCSVGFIAIWIVNSHTASSSLRSGLFPPWKLRARDKATSPKLSTALLQMQSLVKTMILIWNDVGAARPKRRTAFFSCFVGAEPNRRLDRSGLPGPDGPSRGRRARRVHGWRHRACADRFRLPLTTAEDMQTYVPAGTVSVHVVVL